jgi:hypothetical protein
VLPGVIHDSLHTVFHHRAVEVENQAERAVGKSQARNHLGLVNGREALDRLYFYDYGTFDNQIRLEITRNANPAILDWDRFLNFHANPFCIQLEDETGHVHGFEQPTAEGAMDPYGASDDDFGQSIRRSAVRQAIQDMELLECPVTLC